MACIYQLTHVIGANYSGLTNMSSSRCQWLDFDPFSNVLSNWEFRGFPHYLQIRIRTIIYNRPSHKTVSTHWHTGGAWTAGGHCSEESDVCAVHKIPPLNPILNLFNPVQTFTCYFYKIIFNIILPSAPTSVVCSGIHTNFVRISHLSPRVTCSPQLMLLSLIILVISGEARGMF